MGGAVINEPGDEKRSGGAGIARRSGRVVTPWSGRWRGRRRQEAARGSVTGVGHFEHDGWAKSVGFVVRFLVRSYGHRRRPSPLDFDDGLGTRGGCGIVRPRG